MTEANFHITGDKAHNVKAIREIRRITWVGLCANVCLSAAKFAGGILGGSQAVVADAVHSLSDTTSDVAILVGVRYWSAPPDKSHPHGHRRIETAISLFIGALLVSVAVGIAGHALKGLQEGGGEAPGWIAFIVALVSIVSKEILYHWTVDVGKRTKSSALIANAWHHRSDAVSSIPAALAVLGTRLNASWFFLDTVGAVVVSLFIFHAAFRIAWPALTQLTDAGAPENDRKVITQLALDNQGVRKVHAVRTRYIGSGLQVDLHVLIDGDLTVREGHTISGTVEKRLLEDGPDVVDAIVHIEPDDDTPDDSQLR